MRALSSSPAPDVKGASLPPSVPIAWMIEQGYANEMRDRFGEKIPGVGCSFSPSDERMIFHYVTGKAAPANFPPGSAGEAQFTYKSRGNANARAAAVMELLCASESEEAIAA